MDKENIDNIYKHFRYSYFKFSIIPIFLGILLIYSPNTLSYPATFSASIERMFGILLILIALTSFYIRPILRLGIAIGTGVILSGTLGNPSPVAFANDSLLGLAILAISCIPPTRPIELEVGPTIPEGGSYNPSCSGRRAAVLSLSLLAYVQTRHLTASALGIAGDPLVCFPWIYPVMMTLYSLLTVLSLSGGERRWHTRPKIVLFSALITLGAIILTLIPFIFECFLPFFWTYMSLAAGTALIFTLSCDELKATLGYLSQGEFHKKSLLHVLFYGSSFYKETLLWEERSVQGLLTICKQVALGITLRLPILLAIGCLVTFIKVYHPLSEIYTQQIFFNVMGWSILVFLTLSLANTLHYMHWFALLCSIGILFSPVFFHIPLESPTLLPAISFGLILTALSIIP